MTEYVMNDELSAQILTNVLDNTDPTVDVREGTTTFTLQAPNADEFANVYVEMQAVRDETFVIDEEGKLSMFGNRLDKWVNGFGVTRKIGGRATGEVVLTAAEPTLVPAGTQVFAPATLNVLFATDEDVTATSLGATVAVTSVFEGADTNVSSGSITGAVGDLEGVITVTNPTATEGGFDEESDEELGSRYMNYMNKPAASGNANDYYQWSTEVAGVQDALIIPVWDGPGTVKVILLSTEHRAPVAGKVTEVADHIEENRPIDANNITVVAATEIPIDIAADVTLTGVLADVKTEYEAALIEHFKTLNFSAADSIRMTRAENILLDTPGVDDFTDFTINTGTVNIPIPAGSVAVLGTVTLTEV